MAFTLASFLATIPIILGLALSAIVPGSYIVELAEEYDSVYLASHVKPHGEVSDTVVIGSLCYVYINLHNTTSKMVAEILRHASIKNIWPMNQYKIQHEKPSQIVPVNMTVFGSSNRLEARKKHPSNTYPPHAMTQVDDLHEAGVTGRGIKIAIIDSGIDYNHPALGDGCLGPGCLVESYYNFSPDACAPGHLDVMDCDGHGTHMAGIIAAQSNPLGFIGASPGAKLGVYRLAVEEANDFQILQAISRAVWDGASIVVMSFGEIGNPFMQNPLSRAIDGITNMGVACIVAHGNDGLSGPFFGSGPPSSRGATAVASFISMRSPRFLMPMGPYPGAVKYETNEHSGGALDASSAWGPTMDMDVKPQFGVPGVSVLSTYPLLLGGYAVESGTSFASPLVAGIYALLGQMHDGRVKPRLFEQLLSATALPQLFHDGNRFLPGRLAPVPHQGAGLLRALDAALATSVLYPASLSFNDTDSSPRQLAFTIAYIGPQIRKCNFVSRPIQYTVHFVPAVTVYTLSRFSDEALGSPVETDDASATLRFSQSSVTLAQGETATVYVSADVPIMNTRRLPLWSGYIAVNGSDGSALSIPYQGLAGSLRETTVLCPGESFLADDRGQRIFYNVATLPLPHSVPIGADFRQYTIWAPHLVAKLLFASPRVNVYVLPLGKRADDDTIHIRSSQMFEIDTSPVFWLARGHQLITKRGWNGQLKNGSLAAAGTYRFVVKALRVRGDASENDDYDMDVSDYFSIRYYRLRRRQLNVSPLGSS